MGVDNGDMMGSMSGAFGRHKEPKRKHNSIDNGNTASYQQGRRTHTTHRGVDSTVEVSQPTVMARVDDYRGNRATSKQSKKVTKAQRNLRRARVAARIDDDITARRVRRGTDGATEYTGAGAQARNVAAGTTGALAKVASWVDRWKVY